MKKNGDCKIKRLELSGKGVSQGRLTRWADGDERKGNGWKERGGLVRLCTGDVFQLLSGGEKSVICGIEEIKMLSRAHGRLL